MSAARIGAAIIGIIVVQYLILCPTRRGSHSSEGTTRSSITTATASRINGANSHSASVAGPGVRPGETHEHQERRQGERERVEEFQIEAHSLERLGNVRAGSDEQPIERDTADEADDQRQSEAAAKIDPLGHRVGGEGGNEIQGLHDSDLRHAAPSDFSARWSATRTATSVIERRAAVAAIDWPSSEIDWTMSR